MTMFKNQLRKAGIEISSISTEKEDDKSFYQSVLLEEYKKEKAHLDELSDMQYKLNDHENTIASMRAEIKFLRSKYVLTADDEDRLETDKYFATSEAYKKYGHVIDAILERSRKNYEAIKLRSLKIFFCSY